MSLFLTDNHHLFSSLGASDSGGGLRIQVGSHKVTLLESGETSRRFDGHVESVWLFRNQRSHRLSVQFSTSGVNGQGWGWAWREEWNLYHLAVFGRQILRSDSPITYAHLTYFEAFWGKTWKLTLPQSFTAKETKIYQAFSQKLIRAMFKEQGWTNGELSVNSDYNPSLILLCPGWDWSD